MGRSPLGLILVPLGLAAGALMLVIAAARFARRRRDTGAWDERGPKDPSFDLTFNRRLDPRLGGGNAFDRFNGVRADGLGEEPADEPPGSEPRRRG